MRRGNSGGLGKIRHDERDQQGGKLTSPILLGQRGLSSTSYSSKRKWNEG